MVAAGRFPEDGLVPCTVRKANAKASAVGDALAENTFRIALHPLDQFRAYKRMVDGCMPYGEVASCYFTTERYLERAWCSPRPRPSCSMSMPKTA